MGLKNRGFGNGRPRLILEHLEPREMMAADAFEANNTFGTATVLGKGDLITLNEVTVPGGLSIDPAADVDFYQVTALHTGKMIITTSETNVDFNLRDSSGDVIRSDHEVGTVEDKIFPVAADQVYYIEVFEPGNDDVVNYVLQVENIAAPIPDAPSLKPELPGITAGAQQRDRQPVIQVHVNLNDFDAPGGGELNILTAAQAGTGTVPGAAVFVTIVNDATSGVVASGYAGSTVPANDSFTFTPAGKLPDGSYTVTARVDIFDLRIVGTASPVEGLGLSSAPLHFSVAGVNREAFIRRLYLDVLNREADPAGLTFWMAQLVLPGQSEETVADSFFKSAEHRGLQVDGYYRQFLKREADPDGRAFYVNEFVVNLKTEEEIVLAFITSSEYVGQSRNATATGYVDSLYLDVLGRTADSTGESFWVTQLGAFTPATIATVATQFRDSAERHALQVDAYYLAYLHRPADTAGKAFFVNNGQTIGFENGLAHALLESEEYLNFS